MFFLTEIKETNSVPLSNGFLLNESTTKNILFSLRPTDNNYDSHFNFSDNVRVLGVVVDRHLDWDSHITFSD